MMFQKYGVGRYSNSQANKDDGCESKEMTKAWRRKRGLHPTVLIVNQLAVYPSTGFRSLEVIE